MATNPKAIPLNSATCTNWLNYVSRRITQLKLHKDPILGKLLLGNRLDSVLSPGEPVFKADIPDLLPGDIVICQAESPDLPDLDPEAVAYYVVSDVREFRGKINEKVGILPLRVNPQPLSQVLGYILPTNEHLHFNWLGTYSDCLTSKGSWRTIPSITKIRL